MDASESNPADFTEPLCACRQSVRLGAYFDGELDAATAAQIEEHLAGCAACQAELEEIRELSLLANQIGGSGISAARLRKIHGQIDADQGYSFLRIACVLTGLAASVMVICSVWLSEIPASRPQPFVVITATDARWTQVAVDRRVDPLPRAGWEIQDQQMFADARLADWMVDGLSGSAR